MHKGGAWILLTCLVPRMINMHKGGTWILLTCLVFLTSDCYLSKSIGEEPTRDASLRALAGIFNHQSQLFEHWKIKRPSVEHHQAFVDNILSAWLLLEPTYKIQDTTQVDISLKTLNCSSGRYSNVLTGDPEPPGEEKLIIDFIPFGYDIDLLEVRLHETYPVVDWFVIYESSRTQSGWKKPLYFR